MGVLPIYPQGEFSLLIFALGLDMAGSVFPYVPL